MIFYGSSSRLRRERREILAAILKFCRKPQSKTRIMLETNMSYRMLQRHLRELQRCQLLEVHHSREKYVTTEKGLRFLQKWVDLQQLLEPSKPVLYSRHNVIQIISVA
jgi:predicted transcriptional regulator